MKFKARLASHLDWHKDTGRALALPNSYRDPTKNSQKNVESLTLFCLTEYERTHPILPMYSETDFQEEIDLVSAQTAFLEDGFVHFPGFLNQAEMRRLKSHVEDFLATIAPSMPPEMVYYEDKLNPVSLKQIQKLYEFHPYFEALMFKSKFELLASSLLKSEVVGKNLQYFDKPPTSSSATPVHQDGYYFMIAPNEAVTMWLALEKVDEENGCIRYVRGSHKLGMRSHGTTGTLGFSQGITDYGQTDIENEKHFTVKPGDLLVHHALTIHRADANRSPDRSRKALGFVYYSENVKEDIARKKQYQSALNDKLATEDKI